jgi:predicted RNA-binding protein with PIN domain
MDDLARFAASKRVTLEVVFDGAPDSSFGDGSRYKGIAVYYARRGSNADERIKELVEANRERRTLMVITSDRQLADYVRRCGVQVIRSGGFRKQLDALAEVPLSTGPVSSAPVDEPEQGWMRYFGMSPDDD